MSRLRPVPVGINERSRRVMISQEIGVIADQARILPDPEAPVGLCKDMAERVAMGLRTRSAFVQLAAYSLACVEELDRQAAR